jgi:tryptophan synthase alpha chain
MLEAIFERARNAGRSAFIPYIMAGDPDLETTLAQLRELTAASADIIELGIPYGDPLADGPTIAAAAHRALEKNVTIEDVLAVVRQHKERAGVPIVLFSYFNPLLQYGIERFASDAAQAGCSGVIVPDIALEECDDLLATLTEQGLDMPLLVAQTTPGERAARIVERSGGFIYVVSRLGVTGRSIETNYEALQARCASLRALTAKPLAVGFGIRTAEEVRAAAAFADGVIVGSALIDACAGMRGEEAARCTREVVAPRLAGRQT